MASAPQHDAREVELIGGIETRELVLVPYDASWTNRFQAERRRITEALGPTARQIEHIGSTAVPGLSAKPIIDVLVTVESIADEAKYLPHLVSVGYHLRVREPGHRLFRTPDLGVHVHVVQYDDEAAAAYLDLRDRPPVVDRPRVRSLSRAIGCAGIRSRSLRERGGRLASFYPSVLAPCRLPMQLPSRPLS
jgi:hypothetical protein